jgi:cysteine synthase
MATLGLEREVVNEEVLNRTAAHFAELGIRLPTFAELAEPSTIPASIQARLADVDPDSPHPLNLYRVHWFNAEDRRGPFVQTPGYLELPKALTGVDARIVVALGRRFPMIDAHKVLAAYSCLVPRLVTGQFDPSNHKAVWPSTGNYCRGGVAISRILDCHGVAVLPEGMSRERFDWLDNWVVAPEDVIRTVGTESNVKEIYDKCAELDAKPDHIIFNQFCEFANHLGHYLCTGRALERIVEALPGSPRLRAYVSATGSAGTIAAGDYLKDRHGARIVATEALECPTLLSNGFGEHNIQGIGDKHVPYIHNVMNTDAVSAISDAHTDTLFLLFNTQAGRDYLVERHGLTPEFVAQLDSLGFSGIGNVLAAIRAARHWDLTSDDVVITVATDSALMYGTEVERLTPKYYPKGFDTIAAAETFGRGLLAGATDNFLELRQEDRRRIFNLGYYTWVEQQGVSLEEFETRRRQSWWDELRELLPIWDGLIREFNARTGVSA